MQNNYKQIVEYFDEILPDVRCELNYNTPYQLLIAVILSAQCTDKRVNEVTKTLFEYAPTATAMLRLGREKLEKIIFSCGFYSAKADSIMTTSNIIITQFNGIVPDNMDDLLKLKGVGRKTANVVLGECFGQSTFAVDTHVSRIAKRLNIASDNDTPDKIEKLLINYFPIDNHTKLHHQMIHFGRYHCNSRKPNCMECKLQQICKYYQNN